MHKKLLTTVGKFKVFVVDGAAIRKSSEPDWTDFGQHYRFPKLIPKEEFWIDQGYEKEEHFFIDHLLLEYELMAEGKSYKVALTAADKLESRERKRSARAKTCKKNPDKKYRVEKKLLEEVNGLKVYLVDGELVRDWYDPDFVEGGHDLVYTYVPSPNTVWIDDQMTEKERAPTILHETTERALMAKGMSYHKAHNKALEAEWKWRHR